MKKSLVAAIIGLTSVASVMAQGNILLDTYNSTSNPLITYGAANANGTSGGTVGEGVTGFTASLYYFVGNNAAAVNAAFDGSGYDAPTLMSLANPADAGAITPVAGGYLQAIDGYTVPGTAAAPADTLVTLVIIAYNGSSYANSTVRGHSAAFTMNAKSLGSPDPVGNLMPAFSVFNAVPVPEPSTFALAGLGLAGLLIFRRRK